MASEKKIYIVTDLGPGDGGKGGIVHAISCMKRAHTILKVGGAQGSHGVTTSAGDSFAFSQFGCGTFEGVRTHLTERIVVSPEGILNEGEALYYGCGIRDVFDLLTVDENAVCATPYHAIASHVNELARGKDPRGTIGSGVGEAYRYAALYPELTIKVHDLAHARVRDMLDAIRGKVCENILPLVETREFLPEDREVVRQEIALLTDDRLLDFTAERFQDVPKRVKVVGAEYLRRILSREGSIALESSHGILTDHYQGFHPHTSAIRTLPCFAQAMIRDAGYNGEIATIAVTRAYQIRHGAGPMPTADPVMAQCVLPGSHKKENRYQGKVRIGALDIVLLRYAIACLKGASALNGLAVTWFDQIQANGSWRICDGYDGADDPECFTSSGEIRVRFGNDEAQLDYQQRLGARIGRCRPRTEELPIDPRASRDALFDVCAGFLGEKLGVDVRMVSFGSCERDKICK